MDGSDTDIATLANGVRLLVIRMPHLLSASVSVFVRSGSQHEGPRQNGISHVVEHMVFKGTHERDCQRINLDAERLGAEVNAHTDKDHTAFHMRGMKRDAPAFVRMLGDIVCNASFPEEELERERSVLLHEYADAEDDALAVAFRLFDRACFGEHAFAQPVIGLRRNIQRFKRAELLDYVRGQYTGSNIVIGIAGDVDPQALAREAEAAFGELPQGSPNEVHAPHWVGGLGARRLPGSLQTDVVLGYPLPSLKDDDAAGALAAALFGEGMSSPLLDEIRERRGLVYYASCSADVMQLAGQFVIEASTSPQQLEELLAEVARLLHGQAVRIDAVALERARNQIAVRRLRTLERPSRRIEDAVQDLLAYGRVRSPTEVAQRTEAVDARLLREAFERMLSARPALALAGRVARSAGERGLNLLNP
jgi:predicted Zn-dependent peptidase